MKEMLYMVLMDGHIIAQNLALTYAMMFAEALFIKRSDDKSMTVTIQRMPVRSGYEDHEGPLR